MKKWKELSLWKKLAVVFIGLIIVVAATSSSSDQDSQDNQQPAGDSQPTEQQAEQAEQEEFAFDDGTHTIGTDIQPGTYRTRGGDGSAFGCYWERLKGFSGEFDDILANNGDYSGGSQVVTIKETDEGFKTEGCGKWYAELTQVTESKTSFGDGTLIVGTDLEPGTYKNSGAEEDFGCYWARLKGFSGNFSDIIANDNAKSTVVTIAGTDKGFTSNGCGTWTKQ